MPTGNNTKDSREKDRADRERAEKEAKDKNSHVVHFPEWAWIVPPSI